MTIDAVFYLYLSALCFWYMYVCLYFPHSKLAANWVLFWHTYNQKSPTHPKWSKLGTITFVLSKHYILYSISLSLHFVFFDTCVLISPSLQIGDVSIFMFIRSRTMVGVWRSPTRRVGVTTWGRPHPPPLPLFYHGRLLCHSILRTLWNIYPILSYPILYELLAEVTKRFIRTNRSSIQA